MAKLFYSVEEAAAKLGRDEADVREMARKGEITEFRDGDRLIFKKDQIDLLSGDDHEGDADLSGMIPLSDSAAGGTGVGGGSAGGLDLADSGPAPGGLSETKEERAGGQTGISIFDDETEQDDPSAVTRMSDQGLDPSSLDSFGTGGTGFGGFERSGSGSGHAAGDSMLGELYAGGSVAGGAAVAGPSEGLFEGRASSGGASSGAAATMVLAEPYDARGSGMTAGIAVGLLLVFLGALTVLILGMIGGTTPQLLVTTFSGNILIWMGIGLAVVAVLGAIGFALGGKG